MKLTGITAREIADWLASSPRTDEGEVVTSPLIAARVIRERLDPPKVDYCLICDKKINPETAMPVRLNCNTTELLHEAVALPPEDDQGCFMVGPDCARRVREAWKTHYPRLTDLHRRYRK